MSDCNSTRNSKRSKTAADQAGPAVNQAPPAVEADFSGLRIKLAKHPRDLTPIARRCAFLREPSPDRSRRTFLRSWPV